MGNAWNAVMHWWTWKKTFFNKKIARGSGSFLSVAELAVASAGVGGNSKQEALIKQVEFYKLICLTELEKEPSARLMLKEFPDNYALKIKKDDDYFNQHFKYKDNLSIEYMKEKLQK